jgi:IclR family KDG regulon transcriptional repressor
VQAIDRILAILDIVAADGPVAPSEIAPQMDLPFSSVARLVRELAAAGLLDREAGGARGYVLGWKVFDLASTGRAERDLAVVATPAMTELRDATGETVSLHVLRGDQRMCVAEVQSTRELRRVMPAGTVQGLVGTTGGEVLLGALSPDDLEAFAERTGLGREQRRGLEATITAVRDQGFSVTHNEQLGVSAVSVPVRRSGAVVAALTVSGPASRFSVDQARSYAALAASLADVVARAV